MPPPGQVRDLLKYAVASGIRFFDTAPAYGVSEQRLGSFLHALPAEARELLVIATKCGEIWTPEHGSVIDHSPEALTRSVARSVDLLGRLDLLQLHQASSEPDGRWTTQQVRNLLMDLGDRVADFRYLVRDRAGQFTGAFDTVLADVGLKRPAARARMPTRRGSCSRPGRRSRTGC
jgi:aryl-alcohol dehydrogenase-like predicted oxidoreductase